MLKTIFFTAIVVLSLVSCKKHPGCDPGMTYDIGFFRGQDARMEADYIFIDGVKQPNQIPQISPGATTCSSPGIMHVSLSYGTHTIGIGFFNQNPSVTQTLILSSSGATLNGQSLPKQSCNMGNSVLIE